jgi:hypothetical protein
MKMDHYWRCCGAATGAQSMQLKALVLLRFEVSLGIRFEGLCRRRRVLWGNLALPRSPIVQRLKRSASAKMERAHEQFIGREKRAERQYIVS